MLVQGYLKVAQAFRGFACLYERPAKRILDRAAVFHQFVGFPGQGYDLPEFWALFAIARTCSISQWYAVNRS